MTETQIAEITKTHTTLVSMEPGDHELLSHYVSKKDLEAAIFSGIPATALCGKKWLPTKDPNRFPVCKECKDIYESMGELHAAADHGRHPHQDEWPPRQGD